MTRARKGLAIACATVLGAGGAATALAAELEAINIAGSTVQGATLKATVKANIGAKSTMSYAWQRCAPAAPVTCTPIPGAGATDYTLTAGDVGSRVAVRVEVRNHKGNL